MISVTIMALHHMAGSRGTLRQVLEGPTVHCRDIDAVLESIRRIKSAGSHKLQVLTDFDYTLTLPICNGIPGTTSHGVIEGSGLFPDSFNEKAFSLKEKYIPIENCHERSLEEKISAMEEWWGTVHQLIIEHGLKQDLLVKMFKKSNIIFREHQEDILTLLEEHDVPLTLCSAGLADVIYIALESLSYLPKNLTVIGNEMVYNEEKIVTGFHEPIIHSFNKGLASLSKYPQLLKRLKGRSNVILIGDSQGDPFMIDGLEKTENVIKIGFLNHKKETFLTIYENLYDIVLVDPASTLLVPLVIMENILSS